MLPASVPLGRAGLRPRGCVRDMPPDPNTNSRQPTKNARPPRATGTRAYTDTSISRSNGAADQALKMDRNPSSNLFDDLAEISP